MGQPAACEGDVIIAVDTHIVMIPSPGGPVPTPLPAMFQGFLNGKLSTSTFFDGHAAAIVGSTADNMPPHIPMGGPFQTPPENKATVYMGSPTVIIDGQQAARNGDPAMTCNDPTDMPNGTIIAVGTVLVE